MSSSKIRQSFIDYFAKNGHKVVPSSSLVPAGDNTLLFANAGMNQFKDFFTGVEEPQVGRATSSQKCVRAGGKHNDLENVGFTSRHHTFFEMLGNFSFGDYFKSEAIEFAWEFLTKEIQLPKDRLWITIHDSDDEAGELWKKIAGLADHRVIKMGDKDNFWAMGETGPCGPCSEIHFDQYPDRGSVFDADAPDERFLEIWNLVFMQYEQKSDGSRVPLPKPSIDTGMGLERLCSVLGGHKSNYDTDLFTPLLQRVAELTDRPYDQGEKGVSHRVLADHIKASAFLMADGILPSNEGRGYVLRRILRRAIRHAWLMDRRDPTLVELIPEVIGIYGQAYPILEEKREAITNKVLNEENRFLKTIDKGIRHFEKNFESYKEKGVIPGVDAFTLYDTHGFPLDLTEIMAQEKGLRIDEEGFDREMKAQRDRAASASKFTLADTEGLHWTGLRSAILKSGEQHFLGYEKSSTKSEILKYTQTSSGQILVVPENCVFYAESGGQVGDRGELVVAGNTIQVVDCQLVDGYRTLILDPSLTEVPDWNDELVEQRIDIESRKRTAANHTCTHLLHQALKEVVGEEAEQRGSWVGPTHLRFDFPSDEQTSKEKLKIIEDKVNAWIQKDYEVQTRLSTLEQAKADGVTALFGEKYGDEVRVVEVGSGSLELCGGTHMQHTGEALAFRIRSESSVAAGLRRIEAETGPAAVESLRQSSQYFDQTVQFLKTRPEEVESRLLQMTEELSNLKKEIDALRVKEALGDLQQECAEAKEINETKVFSKVLEDIDAKTLRQVAEQLKNKSPDTAIYLASTDGPKVSLIVTLPKALTKDKGLNAGQIVKQLASKVKGGGGGSPVFAQAGGSDASQITSTLAEFEGLF